MRLQVLFKLDFVNISPIPSMTHILRHLSVYLYVTAL